MGGNVKDDEADWRLSWPGFGIICERGSELDEDELDDDEFHDDELDDDELDDDVSLGVNEVESVEGKVKVEDDDGVWDIGTNFGCAILSSFDAAGFFNSDVFGFKFDFGVSPKPLKTPLMKLPTAPLILHSLP